MRRSLLQLRLQWVFVVVLLAALLMWAAVRHREFAELAAYHASREPVGPMIGYDPWRSMTSIDSQGRRVTDWEAERHRRLSVKYRRAASRPWLAVAPDPDRERFREAYRAEFRRRRKDGFKPFTFEGTPPPVPLKNGSLLKPVPVRSIPPSVVPELKNP